MGFHLITVLEVELYNAFFYRFYRQIPVANVWIRGRIVDFIIFHQINGQISVVNV